MSIMPPPAVDIETGTIEAHDWAIPCQYSMHKQYGAGSAASLAAWRTPRQPCGHPFERPFIYFCDNCWEALIGRRDVHCLTCRAKYHFLGTIVRTERI